MGLTSEHVGSKILAKIKGYVLTRAELLITLCYEIPCSKYCSRQVDFCKKNYLPNYTFCIHMMNAIVA